MRLGWGIPKFDAGLIPANSTVPSHVLARNLVEDNGVMDLMPSTAAEKECVQETIHDVQLDSRPTCTDVDNNNQELANESYDDCAPANDVHNDVVE
ncbi:hypothetical protein V6N13_125406 [Hibiscus sabdariffa]|uniref:Uncharacterized protein n=1 Tax=Hibiscus sabdariffa TaxID=183260 RepID=A0ABR2U5S3_9ROSI